MLATSIIDQKIYTEQPVSSIRFSVPKLGKFQKFRSTVQTPKFGIGGSVLVREHCIDESGKIKDDSVAFHFIVNGIEIERCLRYQIAGYKILYKLGDEFGYSYISYYEEDLISYEEWETLKKNSK